MKYAALIKSLPRPLLIGLSLTALLLSPVLVGCNRQETVTQRDIDQYVKLVAQNPSDATNRGTLAGLYLQDKQYSKAIDQYNQILALQKDDVGAITGLAMTYMAEGNKGQAKADFLRVVNLAKGAEFEYVDRRVELAHFYLGTMALDAKNYGEALNQLDEALKSNRADADTNFMLGKALRGLGRLDDAIAAYSQAVALVPNMVQVYQDMADVYGQQGKIGEKNYALGMIALFQKSYDKAIDDLTKATQTVSDSAVLSNAWFGVGYAWEEKGDSTKAADAYTQALKVDANNMLARQGLSRTRGK